MFEWTTTELGSQSAVCAGGRYDGLLEQLGAKNMPGVGWAFGMERVIALMDKLGKTAAPSAPDVFVMGTDEVSAADSLALAEYIRQQLPNASVLHNTGGGSMKSQFRKADKSGAAFAAIIGGDELAKGLVTLKPLLGGGEQQTLPRTEFAEAVQNRINE